MGNCQCQAIDAAALVIQHPTGKIERYYWPLTANEVMKMNPGHYVCLLIPMPVSQEEKDKHKTMRFTRVKLLRPNDILALGHAYRLFTSQEVTNVLRAKKYAKTKKHESESLEKMQMATRQHYSICEDSGSLEAAKSDQGATRQRSKAIKTVTVRSKSWRPSLHSISEAGS